MARNRIQFQKGYSLVQFMDEYGTEEKCTEALFRWRRPKRVRLPPMRAYRALAPSEPGAVSVPALPASGLADRGHDSGQHEAAHSHLVPGDVPDDADEERDLGAGAVAATFGQLQHPLEGQAQADAGDEGARRHAPFGRLGAAR